MSDDIPFRRDLEIEYGVVDQVSPLVRRVVARNPSAFTFLGTGTYIVGRGEVAIIDPGPDIPEHIEAILEAVHGEAISHLLVTHTHRDHSPASRALKSASGATVYAFGPHGSGRARSGEEVEEGADWEFRPDVRVAHGDLLGGDGFTFECVHTPGHTSNHVCFALREEQALFTGDHVMGWSTSIISPPDGHMGTYLESLRLLLGRDDRVYWPTHGPPIDDPHPFVRAYIRHRELREAQVLECLERGRDSIAAMVPDIYRELPEFMHPAAARMLLATVIHMVEQGRVRCDGGPAIATKLRAAGSGLRRSASDAGT